MPGDVGVLRAGDEDYAVEVFEAALLGELEHEGVLEVLAVGHGHLVDGLEFLPLFDKPEAGLDGGLGAVEVTQVRG